MIGTCLIETYLETVEYDCVLVIEDTCCLLVLNRSNILFQLASHDHYLPISAVPGDSTILAAALAPHLQVFRLALRLDQNRLRATIVTFCDSFVRQDVCRTL